MEQAIDQFILYLATERGLSGNYQLGTRRALESFAAWYEKHTMGKDFATVELRHLSRGRYKNGRCVDGKKQGEALSRCLFRKTSGFHDLVIGVGRPPRDFFLSATEPAP